MLPFGILDYMLYYPNWVFRQKRKRIFRKRRDNDYLYRAKCVRIKERKKMSLKAESSAS